ncbi:hypothetical protein L596_016470 [Steinernema carpocapsae]|uniref:Carboxylic ester hydrolase n=1 Tax=Steinernema carpocapsae TaxID=34508 RepID=A0A4U5NJ83_STECR|nr:hypothetical protein L596_016470 [Steinernema carpocapsae]
MYHTMYNEDCLTMNIMAPAEKSKDPNGYPVLVFIYLGGFLIGESVLYSYRNISQNFVSQGIVFVTFNHRLSFFGFFSTGDEAAPGNAGIWDQIRALEFIQDVISDFGGNSNRVTVFGQSSGAKSIAALSCRLILTVNLFQQGIALSGSIYSPGVIHNRVVTASMALARALDCYGSSKEILACLKTKTVDEIQDGIIKSGSRNNHLHDMRVHLRMSSDLFPEPLEILAQKAPKIPYMTGIAELETGTKILSNHLAPLVDIAVRKEDWKSYSAEHLKEFISTKTLVEDEPEDLKDKLIEFYVNRKSPEGVEADWKFYLERFAEMSSNLLYDVPVFEDALRKTLSGSTVYLYMQEYINQENLKPYPLKKTVHGNELRYLLNIYFAGFNFTEDDFKFQKNWLAVVSFTKTGKPTVGNLSWDAMTMAHPYRYMSIASICQMKEGFKKEVMDFWFRDIKKLLPKHEEL